MSRLRIADDVVVLGAEEGRIRGTLGILGALVNKVTLLVILAVSTAWAGTTVRFSADPGGGAYSMGPFPTNALTIVPTTPGASPITGLQVNLPGSEDHCTRE